MESSWRRKRVWFWPMILASFLFGLMGAVLPGDSQAFILNVVDGNGNPITGGFRWLLEEDNTNVAVPGAAVNNSISLTTHKSHAPVITKGNSGGAPSTNVGVPPTTRYFVSVLPDSGYANGGTVVVIGQGTVNVTVHSLPLPTAQISVLAFMDQNPINNAKDENEDGLGGCTVFIADAAGQLSQDAFGNPLGTQYQFDPITGNPVFDLNGDPIVTVMGTGLITTLTQAQFNAGGAQNPYNLQVGEALVKYIPPGKYGVTVLPPRLDDLGTPIRYVQTTTIEGTPVIDAWVKPNEPAVFVEGFGIGFKHVAFGFLKTNPGAQPFKGQIINVLPWNAAPPAGGTGTITGTLRFNHFSKPPATQGFFPGERVPECWVGLNDPLAQPGAGIPAGLYATACDANSNFTISGVPPGTYQLVSWDAPLDALFNFTTVTVPAGGGAVNLGNVLIFRWFGTLKGSIFYDTNQNAVRDPGEVGLMNQNLNLRFRDGSIYQFTPTDPAGNYEFAEVFPFFKWLIVEVDFARFKPTGMTTVVDNGGPLQPMPIYPYSIVNSPQPQPENGNLGWRTETGPVLLEAMHLFLNQTNVIDWGKVDYPLGENGGITGIVYYATTRAENDPRYAVAETWEPGIPRVQVNLYQDFNNDGIPDGPAIDTAFTDSWDDNTPTGCIQTIPIVHGLPVAECADAFHTWNQVRPGVFDGGYAFGSPAGQPTLPPGTYIVEVIPPAGYELVKEEDKNVDFGNSYQPSPLALPASCVGAPHLVPAELSLFPGIPGFYAGQTRPLCDRKQVVVAQGQNVPADFFLFTEVPKAARAVGFTNNDLAAEFNVFSPNFGEKLAPSWIPVSFKDWKGKEIVRVYTDEFGGYNAMLPSTYSVNIPTPSGVSPNIITLVLNDPIMADGTPDPFYNPTFSVTPWTLEYFPGKTTYLDTPLVPMTALASAGVGVDTQPPTLSPLIRGVNGPEAGGGPLFCTTSLPGTLTITSSGLTSVLNPNYIPGVSGNLYITRDYGFGAAQGTVTLNGVPLSITSWTDTTITVTIPTGAATGQLSVTRGDNGRTAEVGVTLNVVNCATTQVRRVSPIGGPGIFTSIQAAIDSPATTNGALIMVGPGTYNENVIMNKPVRLQGAGAGSTGINANPIPTERLQLWHNRMNALGAREFVAFLLKDPFVESETPSIIVVGETVYPNGNLQNPLPGTSTLNPGFPFTVPGQAAIDGFSFFGSKVGGGVFVVSGANYLRISNNEISTNQGNFAGGISVGTPDSGFDANNTFVTIRNNKIHRNGGLQGAGGITINEGAHNYQVTENLLVGNLSRFFGGGIAHQGLSQNGVISQNKVLFNENFFGALLANAGDGGGIYVGGDVAGGTGSGSVTIDGNLIQGNLTGSGNGGGIIAFAINGDDVRNNPTDQTAWYQLKIFNNIIVNNVAARAGAGIFLQDVVSSKAFIINNTIANNDSTATSALAFAAGAANSTPQPSGVVSGVHSSGNVGGVLMLQELLAAAGVTETYANPTLQNNIIRNNRSFYNNPTLNGGAGGLAPSPISVWDLGVVNAVTPVFLSPQNSILTALTYGDGGNYTGNGNLSGNPLFNSSYANSLTSATVLDEAGNAISVRFTPTTVTGDYHIQSASPAIGAGAAVTFPELSQDYDRQIRPNGGTVDIGADEWYTGGTFFTITAAAGVGGSIAPTGSVNVSSGADQIFSILPDACSNIATLIVDGVPVTPAPTSYTFTNVTAAHSILAGFVTQTLAITAQQSPGGTIIPAGATANITCGTSRTYTITANPGFYIVDVLTDLVSIGPIANLLTTTYTFNNINRDHAITALFASQAGAFTIAAAATTPGGTVTPAGATAYNLGASAVYAIAANPGWRIVDVLVDEVSQGPITSYNFTSISGNHTITASFVATGSFLITASAAAGGTIDPAGAISVLPGSNQGFFITPNAGFRIANVVVDGVPQGPLGTFTFTNVVADHTIAATFQRVSLVDFDGDRQSDIALYRVADGGWYIIPSSTDVPSGIGWGADATDKPIPGDYDGDGKTDIAVYRGSNGGWYIIPSSTGVAYGVGWGGDATDRPVPGDYDGDGKTDIAVYRGSNGGWYIIPSSTGVPYGVGFGGDATDLPVPGDYDGDGKTDIAVYRTSTGAWYVIPSTTNVAYGIGFGGDVSDRPVPGDYDGDGKTDIAVYRVSSGAWYIVPSSTGIAYGEVWGGGPTDIPVPGDYDGDGKTDLAIYRGYVWQIRLSSTSVPYFIGWGGGVSDIPLRIPAVY